MYSLGRLSFQLSEGGLGVIPSESTSSETLCLLVYESSVEREETQTCEHDTMMARRIVNSQKLNYDSK